MESAIDHAKQYELEVLDNLILDEINPNGSGFSISEEKLEQWETIARTQRDKILRGIICTTFSLNNEKKAKIYIQNLQLRISFLINTISGYYYHTTIEKNPNLLDTYNKIRECQIDLLKFLSSQYRNYFDFYADAPITFKQSAAKQFEERLEKIFNNTPEVKCELSDIALKPVIEFLSNFVQKDISFKSVMYLDALLKELEKVVDCNKPIEECLKFSLVCVNFNSYRFFAYLTEQIKRDTKNISIHSGRVEMLSKYLKIYNQIHEYPDLVLNSKQKPIKEQISLWIIEEIEYLERTLKLKQVLEPTNSNPGTNDYKLQTDMSVAQLGYLIRIMIEVGIIKNPNQRDVLRLFSGIVKTKHADTISPESLRTRFYNIEENTRLAIKDLVIKMLNSVNKKN